MMQSMLSRMSVLLCAIMCITALSACRSVTKIRIHNASAVDFTSVSVAGHTFGDITAGTTTEYKSVDLRLRYAALELNADGHKVTGQTLNLGSSTFTYEINVVDLVAGQLAIDVKRD